jgi:hypothetical protein
MGHGSSTRRVGAEAPKDVATLTKQVSELTLQVSSLAARLSRMQTRFSLGQYNILAGYLGSNMEPWFLYGVDMPEERRALVHAKHRERDANGKYINVGWPNYVRGILSEKEIAAVELEHSLSFEWEGRKLRLVQAITELDADVLSLVECDHYVDFFRERLEALGYDTVWMKRPRPSSTDGCCIAWKRHATTLA